MRQLMKYYRVRKRDLHVIFMNLKNTQDKVPTKVLRWVMTKKGIPKNYVNIVQDMY